MSDTKIDEKEHTNIDVQSFSQGSLDKPIVDETNADSTLAFMERVGYDLIKDRELTPEQDAVIYRKNFFGLVLLLISINSVLFIDKSCVSYGTLLGLFSDVNISTDQYNNGNSIFYVGYFIGQFPFAYILQKFHLGKSVSLILFSWSLIIFFTVFVKDYGGYIVVRLLLGIAESSVIPALEITLSQFYTPDRRTSINQVFWVSCVGVPAIVAGFIAYGLLYSTSSVSAWKIFMCITGALTFINSVLCFFFYPNDPSEAKWLNVEEKAFLIRQVQESSNSSISQPHVKINQIKECLKDKITWLIALAIFTLMISNNLMFQSNILYLSLGIDNLGTTLIGVVSGVYSSLVLFVGVIYNRYSKSNNTITITSIVAILPSFAGAIGMVAIKWEKKMALVAMLILAGYSYALAFINIIGWASSSCAGQTKKYYRHVVTFVLYSISNIISPQIWKGNQTERYYPAWIVQIVISFFLTPVLVLTVYIILKRRNNERLKYIAEHPDEKAQGQVRAVDPETGEEIIEIVDIANLDLTDLENKFFIYPL